MAITAGNSSTAVITSGADNASVSLPSGLSQDDVVVVALTCDNAINDDGIANGSSSGWTQIYTTSSANPGGEISHKKMGATPDSTVSVARDSTFRIVFVAQAFSGVDTTTTIDNSISTATGVSGMPNPPSHTTVTDGAMRVVTGHLDDDDANTITLSGYTVVYQNSTVSSATTMLGYKIAATAGAENPAAFSGSGQTSDAWIGTHFALRPSSSTNTDVALNAASFVLTVNNLSLDLGVNLAAESFALTAYDLTVSTSVNTDVSLDAASFSLTPYDLSLDFTASLGVASFAWTAYDLDVQKATIVGLDAESFTLTTYDLSLGFSVSLDAASFALTAYDLAIDTVGTTTVQLDAETFSLTAYDLAITVPQPPGRVGGGHGGGTDRVIGDLSVRSWREVAKDKFADEEPSFDNRLPDAIDAAFRYVFGVDEKDTLTSGERKRVITATKRRARDIYPEDPLFDLKVKEINQEIDRLIRLWQEISTSERHAHDSMTVLLLSI